MRLLIVSIILTFLLGERIYANASTCEILLTSLNPTSMLSQSKSTETYLNLLKYLVMQKNALSAESLQKILRYSSPVNIMDYTSENLSIEDQYSFNRAFKNLDNLDWLKIRKELAEMLKEKQRNENHRWEEQESTRVILTPILLPHIINENTFDNAIVTSPQDRSPAIIASATFGTYIFDIKSQKNRPLKNFVDSMKPSFLRLRDGRLIVMYKRWVFGGGPNKNVFIEEAFTGKEIGSFTFADSPSHFVSDLFEEPDGSITALIHAPFQYKRFVFNTKEQRPHFIGSLESNTKSILTTPEGRVFNIEKPNSMKQLLVNELIENGEKEFFNSPIAISDLPVNAHETVLPSGRVIIWAYNSMGFVIVDLKGPTLNTVYTNPRFSIGTDAKLIETTDGSLKVIDVRAAFEKHPLRLAVYDTSGSLEEIPLPVDLDWKSNIRPIYTNFINTQNGETFVVVNIGELDTLGRETPATHLFVINLTTKKVTSTEISSLDVGRLVSLRELDDGKVIALFSRGHQIKLVQLYGNLSRKGGD